jgi:glutamate racemase
MSYQDQPIGVFDSGVGGLTVLKALAEQLPQESFIYLGDTARLPYGTKSPHTICRYALQASQILVKRGIKMLVVACNTATAIALPSLQQALPEIPVIGVIEPGALAASLASKTGHIAVIGTEATVKQKAYEHAIHAQRPTAVVHSKACSLFVALAEEGWHQGEVAEKTAATYLTELLINTPNFTPDCLVLGCTHFPVLKAAIKAVISPEITIVDSAHTTATAVANALTKLSLARVASTPRSLHFIATDAPDRFARIASRFLSQPFTETDIETVDI